MAGDAATTSASGAPPARQSRGTRGIRWAAAVILLVIAAVLVPATLAARYARGQLLNTDRYVATVAPLASDPAVQKALTDRITTEILSRIDVAALIEQASQALNIKAGPTIGSLVSGPMTDWLTNFVHQKVQQFVASPTFATLWTRANRLAHHSVDVILTGQQGTVLSTSGNSVVLDIGPIVDATKQALVAQGFSLAGKVPSINATFTLFQTDQLPKAQRYVRLLDTLANWLPWIALLCFALAVWLAPGHRRGALIGLVITAVLLAAMLLANQVVRHAYTNQLIASGRNVEAGVVVYDTVIRFLLAAVATTLVTVVVIAIWLWLAGPGRIGTAFRGFAGRGSGWIASRLGWPRTSFVDAVERYLLWIYLLLGVLAFVVLLQAPTPATVIWIAVVAVVLTAAQSVLHRLPPATAGDRLSVTSG